MANASKMRIKELQAALGRMGVSTRGMLEKAELVDAYVGALRDGKRPDAAAAGDDVFDDDVVELKTSKMPKAGGGPQQPPAGGSPFGGGAPGGSPFGGGAPGGSPFGGGGGNPFGGGAGGMPNIADIFSGMGGGGMGGNPFGGMGGGGGGMGGVQELLQKAMGNPKVMAAVQKAAGNPESFGGFASSSWPRSILRTSARRAGDRRSGGVQERDRACCECDGVTANFFKGAASFWLLQR